VLKQQLLPLLFLLTEQFSHSSRQTFRRLHLHMLPNQTTD